MITLFLNLAVYWHGLIIQQLKFWAYLPYIPSLGIKWGKSALFAPNARWRRIFPGTIKTISANFALNINHGRTGERTAPLIWYMNSYFTTNFLVIRFICNFTLMRLDWIRAVHGIFFTRVFFCILCFYYSNRASLNLHFKHIFSNYWGLKSLFAVFKSLVNLFILNTLQAIYGMDMFKERTKRRVHKKVLKWIPTEKVRKGRAKCQRKTYNQWNRRNAWEMPIFPNELIIANLKSNKPVMTVLLKSKPHWCKWWFNKNWRFIAMALFAQAKASHGKNLHKNFYCSCRIGCLVALSSNIIKHTFSFMNPIRLHKRCRYLITEMALRMIYRMIFGSLVIKGNGLLVIALRSGN